MGTFDLSIGFRRITFDVGVPESRIAKIESGACISVDARKRYADATGTTLNIPLDSTGADTRCMVIYAKEDKENPCFLSGIPPQSC